MASEINQRREGEQNTHQYDYQNKPTVKRELFKTQLIYEYEAKKINKKSYTNISIILFMNKQLSFILFSLFARTFKYIF